MRLFLFFPLFTASLLLSLSGGAQSLTTVTEALGKGDLTTLSQLMDTEVELSLPGKEDFYSRDQARQLLSEFFASNKPSGFSQVHQGSSKSDDAEYCIGNLTTAQGSYRVYVYVVRRSGKLVLQELRFDPE
jgi:hypothetical protein